MKLGKLSIALVMIALTTLMVPFAVNAQQTSWSIYSPQKEFALGTDMLFGTDIGVTPYNTWGDSYTTNSAHLYEAWNCARFSENGGHMMYKFVRQAGDTYAYNVALSAGYYNEGGGTISLGAGFDTFGANDIGPHGDDQPFAWTTNDADMMVVGTSSDGSWATIAGNTSIAADANFFYVEVSGVGAGWCYLASVNVDFTPSVGTVSGSILPDSYSDDLVGLRVKAELKTGDDVVYSKYVNLDSAGAFTLTAVPVGNYDLSVKTACWLRKVISGITVSPATDTPVGQIILLNGDLDGDNEVTSTDLSILGLNLGIQGD